MVAVLVPFLTGRRRWTLLPGAAAIILLAIPAGVLSLAAFVERLPVAAVIGAAVFPRVYLFLRNRFDTAAEALHVMAAEARGVPRGQVALWHILRPEVPELAALAAVSLKMALSAVIPAEVFGDVPGLGQAVWKAAQGRDLALILPLTLLFAALLQTATWLASLIPGHAAERRTA
jgi:ABC-type dipeptide/oligopeptide/nickel transport system permease component